MDANEIAAALTEIAILLELRGENVFKINAYRKAARALETLTQPLDNLIAEGNLAKVDGIGKALLIKIETLHKTNRLEELEHLRGLVPPGLLEMLRLPGIGPKKVKALYEELGIASLVALKEACESDQIAKVKGFGPKTQVNILEGIAFLKEGEGRVHRPIALEVANDLVNRLRQIEGVQRIEIAGSLRRLRDTVKDIDIVATLAPGVDPEGVMDVFVAHPQVVHVSGRGQTKASVVLEVRNPMMLSGRSRLGADLRLVAPENFAPALAYFTGSKEHNVRLRSLAIEAGYKLNEYALAGPNGPLDCPTEESIYRHLGLAWVPPELREMTGEIAAADPKAKSGLPNLIPMGALKGIFHNHTTSSDGSASLEEMALAARELGLEYFGVADHSQSLGIANGLTPDRVKKQWTEVDLLNAKLEGVHIFKGTEVDILEDGSLDYDDALLAGFDYVVASVHLHMNQPRDEMTARIIKAISHPSVTMLGHPTGRLLLRRNAYAVDLDAVLAAALKHQVMIEINANPWRLDLDWIHVRRARELGILLVINPDAHATNEIANIRYGLEVARRGWCEAGDVFNTRGVLEVTKHLQERKERKG
ncbi:MAG: DNA polymerase/3'-5' exonuclease PolX [Planctomycetota bacterium]|nr:DNA polymerase/3'-5' exonuclease PolX [Planctomycetota bacterium]